MKKFEVRFEIRMKGENSIWDNDSIELKSNDLFGAISEASKVITNLSKGYGESFEIKSWVKEI